MYFLALAALVGATVCDLRRREIPDGISIALVLAAVGSKVLGWHPVSLLEIAIGASGTFLLSAFLFSKGGLGGGDVKLLTAIGAAIGASAMIPFAMITAVVGGGFALVAKRRGEVEIAYAPVMLSGLLGLLPLVWLGQ